MIKIKNCKNVLLNKVLVTNIFIFNQKLLIIQIKYLNAQLNHWDMEIKEKMVEV